MFERGFAALHLSLFPDLHNVTQCCTATRGATPRSDGSCPRFRPRMIFDDHDIRDCANNHQYYDEVHLNNKGGTLPHVVARARDSCCCRI